MMHEWMCCDKTANHQLPLAAAFWIIRIVSMEECSSLMQNLMDSLLYSLSHSVCDSHTVHMLTQQQLPPPLTSTEKLSLFTHAHSSPLSLVARLHQCCTNCSCYINNGWTFSRQVFAHMCECRRYLIISMSESCDRKKYIGDYTYMYVNI